MADWNLAYTPRPQFAEFHKRTTRWSSLMCHRRAGKTVACVNELVIRASYTTKHNARYAYIAPFYRQAKDVAWVYLKEAVKGYATRIRESDLRVELPNGAWITLYGSDNPDTLRGLYLDGVIMDEFGDCRPSLWGEVVLPTLADRKGWAVFIGTVKGKNHFYLTHEQAKIDPDWYDLTLLASQTGILDDEELLAMKAQMTDAQYAQEMECDATAAVMGTYYAALIQTLELKGQISKKPDLYDPEQPVQCAADLGYSDSTAFWFWQERPDGIAIIDYEENQGQSLQFYIDMLHDKPYDLEAVWLPHDARAKTLQTGRSTIEQMLDANLPCHIVPQLKVQQGIDAARLMLPLCHFDLTATFAGIEALRAYRRKYNELTKAFMDTPLHDWASDGSDAFRYLSLVAQQKRVTMPKSTPQPNFKPEYTLDQLHGDREKGAKLSIVRQRI